MKIRMDILGGRHNSGWSRLKLIISANEWILVTLKSRMNSAKQSLNSASRACQHVEVTRVQVTYKQLAQSNSCHRSSSSLGWVAPLDKRHRHPSRSCSEQSCHTFVSARCQLIVSNTMLILVAKKLNAHVAPGFCTLMSAGYPPTYHESLGVSVNAPTFPP
jgi:ArsR family metal-binding transcriptional regulator